MQNTRDYHNAPDQTMDTSRFHVINTVQEWRRWVDRFQEVVDRTHLVAISIESYPRVPREVEQDPSNWEGVWYVNQRGWPATEIFSINIGTIDGHTYVIPIREWRAIRGETEGPQRSLIRFLPDEIQQAWRSPDNIFFGYDNMSRWIGALFNDDEGERPNFLDISGAIHRLAQEGLMRNPGGTGYIMMMRAFWPNARHVDIPRPSVHLSREWPKNATDLTTEERLFLYQRTVVAWRAFTQLLEVMMSKNWRAVASLSTAITARHFYFWARRLMNGFLNVPYDKDTSIYSDPHRATICHDAPRRWVPTRGGLAQALQRLREKMEEGTEAHPNIARSTSLPDFLRPLIDPPVTREQPRPAPSPSPATSYGYTPGRATPADEAALRNEVEQLRQQSAKDLAELERTRKEMKSYMDQHNQLMQSHARLTEERQAIDNALREARKNAASYKAQAESATKAKNRRKRTVNFSRQITTGFEPNSPSEMKSWIICADSSTRRNT